MHIHSYEAVSKSVGSAGCGQLQITMLAAVHYIMLYIDVINSISDEGAITVCTVNFAVHLPEST